MKSDVIAYKQLLLQPHEAEIVNSLKNTVEESIREVLESLSNCNQFFCGAVPTCL